MTKAEPPSTAVLNQFRALVEKAKTLELKLDRIGVNENQWDELNSLTKTFSATAKKINDKVQILKVTRIEQAQKEVKKYREKVIASRLDVLSMRQVKKKIIVRRNIAIIFLGPEISSFDSEDEKLKKSHIQRRSELIRRLSPDGVISWAIAFPPSLWTGSSMSMEVFSCLLHDAEPDEIPPWPSEIRDLLQKVTKGDNLLAESPEYIDFLKAIDNPSRRLSKSRKRKYVEEESERANPILLGSSFKSDQRREVKYLYTSAPTQHIEEISEPFRAAIQNSRQWNLERSEQLQTTQCLSMVFPKDYAQDVSFNIWCGHEDGYKLMKFFGLQLAKIP